MFKNIVYLAHEKQNPFIKVAITTVSSVNDGYTFVGEVMKNKLSLLGGQVISCVDKLVVRNVLIQNYTQLSSYPVYTTSNAVDTEEVDTIIIDSTQILHIKVLEN